MASLIAENYRRTVAGTCNGNRYENLVSFEAETVVQSGQLIILE